MGNQTTDRIGTAMAMLEEGIKALADSDQWRRYLNAQALFHGYSYSNTLLILAQRPDAQRIAGMKTWNALGRHVCKGEKALWILAPVFAAKKTDKDGQNVQDTDDAEARIVCFRPVPVFDVAQTEGEDLPEPVRKLGGGGGMDLFECLAAFNRDNGCQVIVRDFEAPGNGFYDPAEHSITVHIELGTTMMAKTLAHETAHSLLHRDIEVYRAHRGDCELEAESVAFVVLSHFGIDSGDYSFGYVTGWQGGDEAAIKALKASAARIQATARRIIDAIDTPAEVEAVKK